MNAKLSARSKSFRDNYVGPCYIASLVRSVTDSQLLASGGWVGELTVAIVDLSGVSDYIIFFGICSIAWIILRKSSSELAIILGFGFDLVIPLQYANEGVHETYLAKYWPLFTSATLIEGGSYLMLLPDLFNVVVCLKTVFTAFMWMKDKKPWSVSSTRNPPPSPAQPTKTSPGVSPPTGPARSAAPPAPQNTSNARSSNIDPRFPQARDELKKAGYTDPVALDGMMKALKAEPDEKAQKLLKNWKNEKDPAKIAQRMKKYKEKGGNGGKVPPAENSDSTVSGGKGFSEKDLQHINQAIKDKKGEKMSDDRRRKLIRDLKKPGTAEFNDALKTLQANGIKVPSGSGAPAGDSGIARTSFDDKELRALNQAMKDDRKISDDKRHEIIKKISKPRPGSNDFQEGVQDLKKSGISIPSGSSGNSEPPATNSGGSAKTSYTREELENLNESMKAKKVDDQERRGIIANLQKPGTKEFKSGVDGLKKHGINVPGSGGTSAETGSYKDRKSFDRDELGKINQMMKDKKMDDTERRGIVANLQKAGTPEFNKGLKGLEKHGIKLPSNQVGGASGEASKDQGPVQVRAGYVNQEPKVQLPMDTVKKLIPKLKNSRLDPDDQQEYLQQLTMPLSKERFANLASKLQQHGVHVEAPSSSKVIEQKGPKLNNIQFDRRTVETVKKKLEEKGMPEKSVKSYISELARPKEELDMGYTVALLKDQGVDLTMPGNGFVNGHKRDYRSYTWIEPSGRYLKRRLVPNVLLDEADYVLANEMGGRQYTEAQLDEKMKHFLAGQPKKKGDEFGIDIDLHKDPVYFDAYPGKIKATIEEMRAMRKWLDENLGMGEAISDAMLLRYKNQDSRAEATALYAKWIEVAKGKKYGDIAKLRKEYEDEVPEEVAWKKEQARKEAKAKAQAAAEAQKKKQAEK